MQNRPDPSAVTQQTPGGQLSEGPLHGVLGYQLAQASIVATKVFVANVASVHKLRPVEYTVLALVHENEGVTAAELASALAVTAPNMAMWIDRLVQRGFVAREEHVRDRRALHIRATEAGSKVVSRATERIREAESQAQSTLTMAERLMLLELLHKVACCRADAGKGRSRAAAR